MSTNKSYDINQIIEYRVYQIRSMSIWFVSILVLTKWPMSYYAITVTDSLLSELGTGFSGMEMLNTETGEKPPFLRYKSKISPTLLILKSSSTFQLERKSLCPLWLLHIAVTKCKIIAKTWHSYLYLHQ